jgi:hypothetical protein
MPQVVTPADDIVRNYFRRVLTSDKLEEVSYGSSIGSAGLLRNRLIDKGSSGIRVKPLGSDDFPLLQIWEVLIRRHERASPQNYLET